ncbi:ORF-59 [Buzura suppressaria nucleopolyhedrovirus]|uniref:ORF-59 n=1 Tax=Buzura suppressaria nuclear polyhedrosis virus TaxID=74320 RepID=W5VKL2_NPVBS|nr:ORF-59 [Buzura suppressaria nucleopolyhedrovirus]AHH82648.1 ORF-59 [Buzura suppressaria nucleopolyhedrovirus]AKN91031.1 ORF-61 [Buzura suppressaria nucleopolyhedrovirus]QYF10620.1 ac75-like [Buzura suppressaria nucleopolyhedrovirus]
MEFFKTFIDNVKHAMPHVTKIAYVSSAIKTHLLNSDNDKFINKFRNILILFLDRKITLDDMCNVLAVYDVDLNPSQINYFCNQVYLDTYLVDCIQKYIDTKHLTNGEINHIADFIIVEVNKAIING